MGVPDEDKILKRMAENSALAATLMKPGSEVWELAIAGLEAEGIEHGQPGVTKGVIAGLRHGTLSLWRLSDGTFHITERGFSPGNQSLS